MNISQQMKKIILFIILSISVFSKDVNLTLGENVLNNLLIQIGNFNGTGKIDKLIEEFTKTLKNKSR